MVKEETIRKIMMKYFESRNIKTTPTAGAGPDFIVEGKTIETKGSDADFNRAIEQYCDCLLTGKFSNLAVAVPIDLLAPPATLVRLSVPGRVASETKMKYVGVYLIAVHQKFYHLRYLADSARLVGEVLDRISTQSKDLAGDPTRLAEETKEDVKAIYGTLLEALHELAIEKPDLMVGIDTT